MTYTSALRTLVSQALSFLKRFLCCGIKGCYRLHAFQWAGGIKMAVFHSPGVHRSPSFVLPSIVNLQCGASNFPFLPAARVPLGVPYLIGKILPLAQCLQSVCHTSLLQFLWLRSHKRGLKSSRQCALKPIWCVLRVVKAFVWGAFRMSFPKYR